MNYPSHSYCDINCMCGHPTYAYQDQGIYLGQRDSVNLSPYPSYDVAEASSSSLPPGFNAYTTQEEVAASQRQADEEWLSWAFDNALENILRSYTAPSFPASQTDLCGEYRPPSHLLPCLTSGPLELDHYQQCGQSAYVDLNPHQAPRFPVIDGSGYLPSRPLPFPPSLPSLPLPIPEHLSLPPGFPTNHTRPFHEGKDEHLESYSVQTQHDTFWERDASFRKSEARQDGPSRSALGTYAHAIADRHFRPLDPLKKRKRDTLGVKTKPQNKHIIRMRLPVLDEPPKKKRKIANKETRAPLPQPPHQSHPETSTSAGRTIMTMGGGECYIDTFQVQPQEPSTPAPASISDSGRLLASRFILETGKREKNEIRRIRACGTD